MIKRYFAFRSRNARPPVRLGIHAARWGALACLLGFGVLAIPVLQGARMTEAPDGNDAWSELQRLGFEAAR